MPLFSHILTTRAQLGTQILPKKLKKKTQIMQNKRIRFCLSLNKMQHISLAKFRSINWLPTKERVHQCLNAIISSLSIKTVLFIWMKSLNSLRTVEQTQEIVLLSLSTLFARLTRARKPYRTLVPLCGTIYPKPSCKKSLSKPVNRYYCHFDYLGLLLYYHYYYYYPQYHFTILLNKPCIICNS